MTVQAKSDGRVLSVETTSTHYHWTEDRKKALPMTYGMAMRLVASFGSGYRVFYIYKGERRTTTS